MKWLLNFSSLVGLAAMGVAAPAFAASVQFPTYTVGVQPDGSVVMSTGQVITPAGQIVDLGSPVRAKTVAINPNPATHSAAVLQMGAANPVQIIDLDTGMVVQSYTPSTGTSGAIAGLTYSANGKFLFFSQDYSTSMSIAAVDATGKLTEVSHVVLPQDPSIPVYTTGTSNPADIAVSADGKSAYVLLNNNNTVGVIDLMQSPPALTKQIRVGNAPFNLLMSDNALYVTNEGGRHRAKGDFVNLSSGTEIVSDAVTGASTTGTVSVIDTLSNKVVNTINVGLHPVSMAYADGLLFVANAHSESISVIDTLTNRVMRTISVALPVLGHPFGAEPVAIAVVGSVAYVSLYTANAIAVVDLSGSSQHAVMGLIPTASTPTTIAYDAQRKRLVVANDKGVGTQGSIEYSKSSGAPGYNTHHDTGTVELIPVPTMTQLAAMTRQVKLNNHWDLAKNIEVGPRFVNPGAKPKAIPDHIGEPSLIKHVFLIVKENRTYDQVFGDDARGNGDLALAEFGQVVTPNQHALARRWGLLDNYYDPSRQSADGHPWILQAIAPHMDEIQSPDWVRSYPSQSNDALAYSPKGWLWTTAAKAGLAVKDFGLYLKSDKFQNNPKTSQPFTWTDYYNAAKSYEAGGNLRLATTITPITELPSLRAIAVPHFPIFELGVPDQFRVDLWEPNFKADEAAGTLPALTMMWIMCDHTSGYSSGVPIPTSAVADNDLAVGRIVDTITHSKDWTTSAIFITEDDAQNGLDHVDGHRSTALVISPYAVQTGLVEHTYYTQLNMTRTIEQILGLPPMTQFDLVATPMTTLFSNVPNLAPFDHLANTTPLDTLPATSAANSLPALWNQASNEMFRGKMGSPDSVDASVLNHIDWYAATGFTKPYPGDTKVKPPSDFAALIKNPKAAENDGDE